MEPTVIFMAGGTMLVLAVGAGYVLSWANRAFHVDVDPRVDALINALPGANCGGCGYVGCASYAEAVAEQGETVDKCPVGGEECARMLADIMGIDVQPSWPRRPAVHCRATTEQRLGRHTYRGEPSCSAANGVAGIQGCTYGCLGLGDCVRACTFDAIHVRDGVAVIDYNTCTGCGACARVCPRNIISMVPFKAKQMLIIACSNLDFGKEVKNVCRVGCIGCKACSKRSAWIDFSKGTLPTVDYDAYDPDTLEEVQTAVEKCPMEGLVYVGTPPESEAAKEEEQPPIVTADFATTVDNTDWRG